jgi:hypothetical protein
MRAESTTVLFMLHRRVLVCAAALFVLAGCATPLSTVPADYAGPTAQLDDSTAGFTGTKADFFVAVALDGQRIQDSVSVTQTNNRGRGFAMNPILIKRPLVAERPVQVDLRGITHHAAPILALTSRSYEVAGTVQFVPKAGARYVVRGQLAEAGSSVWIEDSASGERVAGPVAAPLVKR